MDITFNNYQEYLQVNDFLEKKRIQFETVNLYNEMNSFINDNIVHLDDSTLYTEKAKEESKGFLSKVWDFLKKLWAKIVKLFEFVIKKLFQHDVKIKELEAKVKKLEQANDKDFEEAHFSDKDAENCKTAFKEEMKAAGIKEEINLDSLVDKVKGSRFDTQGKEAAKNKKTVFLSAATSMIKKLPKAMIFSAIGQLRKNNRIDDLTINGKSIKINPKVKNVINSLMSSSNKKIKESTEYYSEAKYTEGDAFVDLGITFISGAAIFIASLISVPLLPVIASVAGLLGIRCLFGTGKKVDLDELYTRSCMYYSFIILYTSILIRIAKIMLEETDVKELQKEIDLANHLIDEYNNCKYINKEFHVFFNYVNNSEVNTEYIKMTMYFKRIFGKNIQIDANIDDILENAKDMKKAIDDVMEKLSSSIFDVKTLTIRNNYLRSLSNLIMRNILEMTTFTNKEEFRKTHSLEIATNGIFSGTQKYDKSKLNDNP